MLQEQRNCSEKAIFLEPLGSEKKVPKLSFSPAKACVLPNSSYAVTLSTAGHGNAPPAPCLASTSKMEHNSQIAK